MPSPRFLRLLLLTTMLLIGSGIAEGVHLSQDHSGPHSHHHDINHCDQCFFLMHGQTQPDTPTLGVIAILTVQPVIITQRPLAAVCGDRLPRNTRAPPFFAAIR